MFVACMHLKLVSICNEHITEMAVEHRRISCDMETSGWALLQMRFNGFFFFVRFTTELAAMIIHRKMGNVFPIMNFVCCNQGFHSLLLLPFISINFIKLLPIHEITNGFMHDRVPDGLPIFRRFDSPYFTLDPSVNLLQTITHCYPFGFLVQLVGAKNKKGA